MRKESGLIRVWQLAPEIWRYQLVTKAVLAILLFLIRQLTLVLLHSTGRVAVSSGDWRFLFATWQGPLILALFLAVFFVYVSIDLNVKILYSGNVLDGVQEPVLKTVERAVRAMPRFLNLHGLGVVLYVTLLSPVVGIGLGVSLTENLQIPNFISSVIQTTPVYNTLYTILVLFFAILGLLHLFCLHGVLLDGLPIRDARRQSNQLIRKHWKDYLKRSAIYWLYMAALSILGFIALFLLPLFLIESLPLPVTGYHFAVIFVLLLAAFVSIRLSLLLTPVYIIRLTQMYRSYLSGNPADIPARPRIRQRFRILTLVLVVLVCGLLSAVMARYFEEVFPASVTVQVIAHRGGGNEGTENTVSGLETAVRLGAIGSEIDIQRTADGDYIVNHDATFQRTAGDSRRPEDLTLSEAKRLRVQGSEDAVASFAEMLDAAKDRILLFVELKGATADERMCDDAVRMIRERGMEQQTVLISLKYNLIAYIETHYPTIQTGYLTFLSYGDTYKLPCDYLGLEEESATADAIDAVHQQGKKALVWTPNTVSSQEHFLAGKADAIITDNISQANEIRVHLEERSDIDRIAAVFSR